MKLILLIFAAVLGCSSTGLLHAETDTNTEVRVLPRTRPDRLYQLTIALPPSFREHPDRKYPVILVVEGYWGLAHTAYLAGLPASKPGGIAVVSPTDSTRRDSGAVVFAANRSEAVAMAAADPAVKTGILTYEVLPEADN